MKRLTKLPAIPVAPSDFNLAMSVYDSIGFHPLAQWHKLSKKEQAVVQSAMVRADNLRLAAWDPGAAYLSGVLDVLASLRKHDAKSKKMP